MSINYWNIFNNIIMMTYKLQEIDIKFSTCWARNMILDYNYSYFCCMQFILVASCGSYNVQPCMYSVTHAMQFSLLYDYIMHVCDQITLCL